MKRTVLLLSLLPVMAGGVTATTTTGPGDSLYSLPVNISDIISSSATVKEIRVLLRVEECDEPGLQEKMNSLKYAKNIRCAEIEGRSFVQFMTPLTLGGDRISKTVTLRGKTDEKGGFTLEADPKWQVNLRTVSDDGRFFVTIKNDDPVRFYKATTTQAVFDNYPATIHAPRLKPGAETKAALPVIADNPQIVMEIKTFRETSPEFKAIEKRANAGDAEAMYELAGMYEKPSRHNERDGSLAQEWYKKAADLGLPRALYTTARNYHWLSSQDRNPVTHKEKAALAVEYLKKAAAANDPLAQYQLAEYLNVGYYLPGDPAQAAELLRKAAEQGVRGAQQDLGKLLSGQGNKIDGYAWYTIELSDYDGYRKILTEMKSRMTPEEQTQAEKQAAEFRQRYPVRTFDYER